MEYKHLLLYFLSTLIIPHYVTCYHESACIITGQSQGLGYGRDLAHHADHAPETDKIQDKTEDTTEDTTDYSLRQSRSHRQSHLQQSHEVFRESRSQGQAFPQAHDGVCRCFRDIKYTLNVDCTARDIQKSPPGIPDNTQIL